MPTDNAQDIFQSVVRVTSRNPDINEFGSGFVVYHDAEQDTHYIVTCTHVIHDVGGADQVQVEGKEATIIVLDPSADIDLVVLRVAGLGNRAVLSLKAAGERGTPIEVTGFSYQGKQHIARTLHGTLGGSIAIDTRSQQGYINAWDLKIDGDYVLEPGYSGSPVVEQASGNVLAIVSHRVGSGQRGMALSVAALAKLWRDCPLSLNNAQTLTPTPQESIEKLAHVRQTAQTARDTMQTLLNTQHGYLAKSQPANIGLFSYPRQGDGVHIPLLIDWEPVFHPEGQPAPPPADIWHSILLPTLQDLRKALGRHNIPSISLYPRAHLSVGFALGYIFRYPAHFHFAIEQPMEKHIQWWNTQDTPASGELLQQSSELIAQEGDITIELNISRDIHPTVSDWMQSTQQQIHYRVLLTPVGGARRDAVPDSSHAVALAAQIGESIRNERDRNPRATIHLFAALPLGLAILSALHLNRCGPVQCYEYVSGNYQPSCLLV
jgi:hypothetical protein